MELKKTTTRLERLLSTLQHASGIVNAKNHTKCNLGENRRVSEEDTGYQ